jgi:hypothetical protein
MASGSKPPVIVVNNAKPKVLTGLNQKVRGRYRGLLCPRSQTRRPPANRRGLNHLGMHAERGKPVVLPAGTAHRKVAPMGRRVRKAEQAKAGL